MCSYIVRIRSLCNESHGKINKEISIHSQPRLPPMDIPSFDGDIRNWSLFHISFKSNIHNNESLSNDDKLYYLLGKLTNKARNVFSGITPCPENYLLIWNELVDRYEDPRMLASTYIDQLINFKLEGPASAKNFQHFLDNYVSAVNALKTLKLMISLIIFFCIYL